ncbi:DNA repair protein RecN [Bacterioplanes sanyensis]|uniref:DNA repair protein RecN n=1 Tax=Bacterioplanes sanyensis TaxID=1249553 RepID=A0A222FDU7_9GAMM|nr:DNA repair protein RecN [Bacterioplanes sanyensis]ASP37267.1 DNA repair protein RecN [Bacterioplanes sanyensis]
MLSHLSIRQFALVEQLELEFQHGMVVITGETGAGKSILLDALGLALGNRAEAGFVRQGAERAEVTATFQLTQAARQWLQDKELLEDHPTEEQQDVLLRRIVSNEGRSRAYINGHTCTLNELRQLAECLIDIHAQHAHQRLLQPDTARQLLDNFAGLNEMRQQVSQHFRLWQRTEQTLRQLREHSAENEAQKQLLSYQVEELRELALGEHELEELEREHKRLAGAETVLLSGQQGLVLCLGDEHSDTSAVQLAWQAIQQLQALDDEHPDLNDAKELLQQGHIQLEEAGLSLQRYLEQVDINPHRLQQVEGRLSELFSMARKHHTTPQSLYDHWQQLEQQLADISLSDDDLELLQQQAVELQQQYQQQAELLSQQRQAAAQQLDQQVAEQLQVLALGQVVLQTGITSAKAASHGIDTVELYVQTNPGMPMGPLAKVASGGELARISLAIQVVTAQSNDIGCIIFDEVDVGIGGGTAERVGRLMRTLGDQTQVMCVTHQPQVAAQAHQHFQVSKISGDQATHTHIRQLNDQQRCEEVARMLGGIDITRQTLAHAQEMLKLAH